MIEVFKTNVDSQDHAEKLVEEIQKNFAGYKANFDLQDCDNILRVKSTTASIESNCLISFIKDLGFEAEILPDECSSDNKLIFFSARNC